MLELDHSEVPFGRLLKARALPFRSPMAIPDTAQTPQFVELLELSSRYSGVDAPRLITAMSDDERQALHQHLSDARVIVQHLVMLERAKILAR